MKVFLAVLLAGLVVAEARQTSNNFAEFKAKNGKNYTAAEDATRSKIWAANKVKIDAHNAAFAKGQVSYSMEDNFMADMTDAEIAAMKGALRKSSPRSLPTFEYQPLDRAFPATLNLSSSTCMPPIKNQARCGSCWAFSAVNPIEYQLCNRTKKLVTLSEQQLVSCSSAYGNAGCNGGWYDYAWNYIFAAGGITNSTVLPYTSGTGTVASCTFKSTTAVAKVQGYATIYKNETAMQEAVANYGPLSVAIHANNNFSYYASGVYKDTTCYNDGSVNHAVNIVGYGTNATAGPFWIVRNSWGVNWGQRGYMLMARGVNTCGVAMWAEFPLFV